MFGHLLRRDPVVAPKVDPRLDATDEEYAKRMELVCALSVAQHEMLHQKMQQLWTEHVEKNVCVNLRGFMPATPPTEFVGEVYWQSMFDMFGHDVKQDARVDLDANSQRTVVDDASACQREISETAELLQETIVDVAEGGSGESSDSSGLGIACLLQGPLPEDDSKAVSVHAPLVWVSGRQILEGDLPGHRYKYEGVIVDCNPDRVRYVDLKASLHPSSKRSLSDSSSTALDFLTCDKSGPTICNFWDDALASLLNQYGQSVLSGKTLIVHIENFQVVPMSSTKWNGNTLTRIRLLQSVSPNPIRGATTVSIVSAATSPYLTSGTYLVPKAEACIFQFAAVRSRLVAPFRGTFQGVIVDLYEPDYTRTQSKKRCFDLVDMQGSWIRCCAIGKNADSPALVQGYEVVLYNGTGRGPIGSQPGFLYLYLFDSVIIGVAKKDVLVWKRQEMPIT